MKHYDRDTFTYETEGENAVGTSGITFTIGPDGKPTRVLVENLNVRGEGVFKRGSWARHTRRNELARRRGLAPEVLALNALRKRFLAPTPPVQARDEWERHLLGAATDCGVSLSHAAVSSEGLYE